MISKRHVRVIAFLAFVLLALVPAQLGAQTSYPSAQGQYPRNFDYGAASRFVTATTSNYPQLFASGGPCVGLSSCSVIVQPSFPVSGYLAQSVFYNGRYWNFNAQFNPPRLLTTWGPGSLASSVARWKNGPCVGKTDTECMNIVATRDMYTNGNGYLREQIRVWGTKSGTYTLYYFDPYTNVLLMTDYIDTTVQGGGGGRPRP